MCCFLFLAWVLERMGFSHLRPTYTLAKADLEKQKTFKEETFPTLKKLFYEEINHISLQDKSMIRDYQAIQKTWFPKGKQRQIHTYSKHQGVKLIGTLNYETGEIFYIEEEKYDAEVFLRFSEKIIAHYPHGKIAMVLDNSRIHQANLIHPFLQVHKNRLQFVFFSSTPQIKLAVRQFISRQNENRKVIIDCLCFRF